MEYEQGRVRERGRHRLWSRLQTLSCQHREQRGAWTNKLWDHDLSWSRLLNRDTQVPLYTLNLYNVHYISIKLEKGREIHCIHCFLVDTSMLMAVSHYHAENFNKNTKNISKHLGLLQLKRVNWAHTFCLYTLLRSCENCNTGFTKMKPSNSKARDKGCLAASEVSAHFQKSRRGRKVGED